MEVPATRIDLSGLRCPLPVLRTKKALSQLAPGQTLEVLTTDPASKEDIPAFARLSSCQLLDMEQTTTGHRFLLRK